MQEIDEVQVTIGAENQIRRKVGKGRDFVALRPTSYPELKH